MRRSAGTKLGQARVRHGPPNARHEHAVNNHRIRPRSTPGRPPRSWPPSAASGTPSTAATAHPDDTCQPPPLGLDRSRPQRGPERRGAAAQYSAAMGAGMPAKSRPTVGASASPDSPAYRAKPPSCSRHHHQQSQDRHPFACQCHILRPTVPLRHQRQPHEMQGPNPDEMKICHGIQPSPLPTPSAPISRATGPSNTSHN